MSIKFKNSSLIQVFKLIESNSNYSIIYNDEIIRNSDKLISGEFANADIVNILDEVFKNETLTYRVVDQAIIIRSRNIAADVRIQQQKVNITGKVTDLNGDPLPGVNVYEKDNPQHGVITGVDGSYSIEVDSANDILIFSFIGFSEQEINVAGKTIINVNMAEDSIGLDEVVAIGYGTVKKSDLTGSVAGISSKELKKVPFLRADDAIQGRSAGVQISKVNGAPGADMKIRIRGANSINGSNEPLYVVDGFIGGNLKSVSMNDIESIDILKDASSTAIYGSRGANGVVIITTKRSKVEKPQIEFSTSHGFQQVANTIDVIGAVDFAEMVNLKRNNINPDAPAAFSQQQIDELRRTGGTDWQDEIYEAAPISNYQISLSGGTKNSKYYLSGNYSDQDGIIRNTGYKKFGMRSNIDVTFNDKLSAGLNFSADREKYRNKGVMKGLWSAAGAALVYAPTEDVYNPDGTFTQTPPYASMGYNPVYLAESPNNDEWKNAFIANGKLEYKITNDLTLKVSGGMTLSTGPSFYGGRMAEPGAEDYRNVGAGANSYESTSLQNTNLLNYTKTFGKHKIVATAIYEQQKFTYKSMGASANNFPTISMGYYGLSLGQNQYANAGYSESSMQSYVGRVNYSLSSKYLFTATLRADGSSKFRDDNKYGYFPSGAFAWRLSEEPFIKNLNLFHNLKFRASYGVTGSQAIDPFATMQLMNLGQNYAMNGSSPTIGIGPGSLSNPDLKWEETTQSNVGLDISLFDGRLDFTFDAYKKQTKDLLLKVELPNFTGMADKWGNVGQIDNEGLEFSFNGYPIESANFTWKANFNISFNQSEVVSLGEYDYIFSNKYGGGATAQSTYIIQEGEPLGQFWGQKFDGLWQINEADEAAKYKQFPGDAKLRDADGDLKSDYMVIGNGAPDFIWGFGSTFNYKSLDLVFFVQGVQGNQIFNMMKNSMYGGSGDIRDATIPEIVNHWTPENQNTNIPALSSTTPSLMQSSVGIEDGSYIKLKSLSLGYTLPKSFLSRLKIQEARLSLSAYNLFTITDYSGLDPEISTSEDSDIDLGIDNGSYPNPRSFMIGIDLKF
ncbi:MAG: TonB-dependent receptor [Marinilabiliaceae bacterium]|nr:TonB-dependent receptor [Marinilabiliaceae bacterium]